MKLPPLRDARGRLRRGRFIVLEGIDGAGTTTQTAAVVRALNARGERTEPTAEPSDGPLGTLARQALSKRLVGKSGTFDPTALALLFAADRMDHVRERILPALGAGTTLVCDRYVLSSMAYQGLTLDAAAIARMNEHAPAPDLTLFVAVPPKVAEDRRKRTRSEDELFDALTLQRRVDRNYRRAVASRRKHERIAVVDGTEPPEQVTRALLAHIDAL